MKARPRSVENRVADALNEHFSRQGFASIERIPVLGRTGPDLSYNELKLIVDVKSRIEVPKALFFPLLSPFKFDNLIGVRLAYADLLWAEDYDEHPLPSLDFSSKIVRDYVEHMEAWTRVNVEDGVSCVIVHRPEMPIGASVAIIHLNSRRRLIEYAREHTTSNFSAE